MAEQSLMERVDQLGVPQPTTAFGASSIGATPQQAAMAGTKAAKQAVIKKEDTLAGAQRLQAPVEPIETMRKAEAQAKQIQAVGGSLTNRIQTAVTKQLNTIQSQQAGQAQVNESSLGSAMGLSGTLQQQRANPVYQQASSALLRFASNPTDQVKMQTLEELRALGIQDESITGLLTQTAAAVGKQVTEQVSKPLTVSELDLKGLVEGIDNIDQLSATLGIDKETLSKTSVSDLPKIIQDVQQRELSQVQSLQAQLASAPPGSQQAAILLAQLQQLQGAGVATAEANVAKTIQDINLADEISIGGANYSAQDLFEDDQLSYIITNWMLATTPEAREKIISSKDYKGLTDWLAANESALGELVNKTGEAVKTTSSAITAQKKAEYDASTEGQLHNGGHDLILTAIKTLPEAEQQLIMALPPAEIVQASKSAELLNDPLYSNLGITATNGFVLDKNQQARLAERTKTIEAVRSAGHPEWFENPAFAKLNENDMRVIAAAPDGAKRVSNLSILKNNLDVATPLINGDPNDPNVLQDLVSTITGNSSVTVEDLRKQYQDALRLANLGDADAKRRVKLLEDTFGVTRGRKGVSVLGNAKVMQDGLRLLTKSYTAADAIKGSNIPSLDYGKAIVNIALEKSYVPANSLYSTYANQLADGKIDEAEMEAEIALDSGKQLTELLKTMPNSEEYIKLLNKTSEKVNNTKATAQAEKITKANGNNTLENFTRGLDTVTLAGYTPDYIKMVSTVKDQIRQMGVDDPSMKPWADAMVTRISNRQAAMDKLKSAGASIAKGVVDRTTSPISTQQGKGASTTTTIAPDELKYTPVGRAIQTSPVINALKGFRR